MKANVFLSAASVVFAALLSYLMYCLAGDSEYNAVFGCGSIVGFVVTIVPLFGVKYERSRIGVNLSALSAIFFVLFLVCNSCFAMLDGRIRYFIICNGAAIVVYLLVFYKIYRLRDV